MGVRHDEAPSDRVPIDYELDGRTFDKNQLRLQFPQARKTASTDSAFAMLVPGSRGLEDVAAYYKPNRPYRRDQNLMYVTVRSWQNTAEPGRMKGRDLRAEWERGRHSSWPGVEEMQRYGLQCYAALSGNPERSKGGWNCLGRLKSGGWITIRYEDLAKTQIIWPMFHGFYVSPRYNGILISWDAYLPHIQKWQDIEEKIDRQLTARNLLEP